MLGNMVRGSGSECQRSEIRSQKVSYHKSTVQGLKEIRVALCGLQKNWILVAGSLILVPGCLIMKISIEDLKL